MRKVTGNRLQVTVIVATFILLFLLPTACCLPPILAADSTPSADIKAKLEELKKEIASKAAKIKDTVDRKLKNKAYIGKIKTISPNSITLAADSGPKIVSINQDTVFESGIKGKKYSPKLLSQEDFIVALGDIDETHVLTAKKIKLLPQRKESDKVSLWGQVIAISERLVTVKNKGSKNIAVSLPSDSKVKLNEFVILTGNFNKNDIFKAEFVYVIPQGGILKPKKVATPSAQEATKASQPIPKSKKSL